MGIPQITDRLRMGPTEVLRAVFTGIGRILMTADRPQVPAAGQQVPAAEPHDEADRANGQRGPSDRGRPRPSAPAPAPAGSRWRSLDETGNVRLLSPEDLDDGFGQPGQSSTTAPQGQPGNVTRDGQLTAETADEPTAATVTTATSLPLPLPGYDNLSLASIRARLRGLDVDQLRVLASYEATHAERPEVLGMFERRIEKLEAGG